MNSPIIVILCLSHIALFAIYLRLIPKAYRLIFPGTVFYASILANFPFRALLISDERFNKYNFTVEEIASGLAYSAGFLLLFNVSIYFLRPHIQAQYLNTSTTINHSNQYYRRATMIAHSLFLLTLFIFTYKLTTGRLHGLYTDISDLYFSASENLFMLPDSLKWLFLPLAASLIASRKSPFITMELFVVVGMIVFEAFVSTSKAPLAYLFLLYIFWLTERRKQLSMVVIPLFLFTFLGFGVYSYIARRHASRFVRERFEVQGFKEMIDKVASKLSTDADEATMSVADRFNYLDGLLLCARQRPFLEENMYNYGSLVDIGNLIPRAIWPDRPLISFNHHLTQEVWGLYRSSESPIGRVGESFYVLGNLGVVYACVYAFMFLLIFYKLYFRNDPFLKSVFFWILIVNCAPDNFLFYKSKEICYLMPIILLLYYTIQNRNLVKLSTQEHLATK